MIDDTCMVAELKIQTIHFLKNIIYIYKYCKQQQYTPANMNIC